MSAAAPFLAVLLAAAVPDAPATAAASPGQAAAAARGPDLELHVPRAEVKKVSVEVESLQARIDVDTRVADLVHISAGVVATVQKLKVELDEVAAETHLVVRLDRVADVMSRALDAIERAPALARPAGSPPEGARGPSVAAGAATEVVPVVAPAVPPSPAGNPTGVKP